MVSGVFPREAAELWTMNYVVVYLFIVEIAQSQSYIYHPAPVLCKAFPMIPSPLIL